MKRKLSPSEIKSIRESLGLSRSKASVIFGGGRGAFSKFETGTRNPSTATITLLQIARDYPRFFKELMNMPQEIQKIHSNSPFEVSAKQIEQISPEIQIALTSRLLEAEAWDYGIPLSSIHVSEILTVKDDGVDASISWNTPVSSTNFLPSNNCIFQLKAREVAPNLLAKEVVGKDATVKKSIREVIEQKGTYVVLCSKSYTKLLIEKRRKAILETIRKEVPSVSDKQIEFRDGSQIARWVNHHPAVAKWTLEQLDLPLSRYCCSWDEAIKFSNPQLIDFVFDERFAKLQNELSDLLDTGRCVRVVGNFGIGKTRMVLECFSDQAAMRDFSSLILYAKAEAVSAKDVLSLIRYLIGSNKKAIVIVDGYSANESRTFRDQVQHPDYQTKVITIEDEFEESERVRGEILIEPCAPIVNEKLVHSCFKKANQEVEYSDGRLLVDLTKGYPELTLKICDSWQNNESIAGAKAKDILERFVDDDQKNTNVLKTARLVAVCGRLPDWESENTEKILYLLDPDLPIRQFKESVLPLIRRSLVIKYGRNLAVEPKVLSLKLAEYQWDRWNIDKAHLQRVLLGNLPLELKKSICRQLSLINDRKVSQSVVKQTFDPDLIPLEMLREHQSLLPWLVQIEPHGIVELVDKIVDVQIKNEDQPYFADELLDTLIRAAYVKDSYEISVEVILKIATKSTNYTPIKFLEEIHSLYLGSEADFRVRLLWLKSVVHRNRQSELTVLQKVLKSIITHSSQGHWVGLEKHGVRKAVSNWKPDTLSEIQEYLTEASVLLRKIAKIDGQVGKEAIASLGKSLGPLLHWNLFELVIEVIDEIHPRLNDCWAEAIHSLRRQLEYPSRDWKKEEAKKIEHLLQKLTPDSISQKMNQFLQGLLPDRLHLMRTKSSEEYDVAVSQEIKRLAKDVYTHKELLKRNLSALCSNTKQLGIFAFGKEIAITIDDPQYWLGEIENQISILELETRSFDFLLGFIRGMYESSSLDTQSLKKNYAYSTTFVPIFPRLCRILDIEPSDVHLAIESMTNGYLEPSHISWTGSNVLDNVSESDLLPLLDYLIPYSPTAYVKAVEILALNYSKFDGIPDERFRVIIKMAHNLDKLVNYQSTYSGRYFSKVFETVLFDDSQDSNTRRLATILTQKVMFLLNKTSMTELASFVNELFERFPDIAIIALKQEVQRVPENSRLEYVMSDPFPRHSGKPLILAFPIELLLDWCHESEEIATRFLGRTIPFSSENNSEIHPNLRRIIDEFGSSPSLWHGIALNIGSHPCMRTSEIEFYYDRNRNPIRELFNHDNSDVRNFARKLFKETSNSVERARSEERQRIGRNRY